ncbi:MAG: tRNA (adenosine(37)-N6)-dimethylallyltransferase MiaA [Leptospiraceae bacterium]|nr:tRNA (adenosine(37)-N6)-dimethylallyltransferase MiaA [Leptospiraceae bacterium]
MRVVILAGPTGSGKTEICKQLNPNKFEVLSFDSRQVYKYLSIGTTKPSTELREKIPHHLVDYLDPTSTINASSFCNEAEVKFQEVIERDKIPVITCGTGFYLKAFLYGMYDVPTISDEIKEKIFLMSSEERWELLKSIDLEATNRIHRNDEYRISRALEVNLSGVKWSSLVAKNNSHQMQRKDFEFIGIWIHWEKNELHRKIETRAQEIIENGFIEETEFVMNRFGENCPALKSLGYNFALDYIHGKITIESLNIQFAACHREYAKRQTTWFKKEPILKSCSWDESLELLKKIT